jgi:hypothetical protein
MTQAQAILAFRDFTNEWDTVVVPDSGSTTAPNALDYLQRGAEALNDRVGYFWKEATLTLVDGDESALPTDLIEVVFVTVDGVLLKPTDIEQLNQDLPDWRNAPKGLPREFYVYSKVGFFPVPNADAVALTTKIRYLSTPTITSGTGFDLLATQHHRLPVYYAAALWFEAHGLDGDGHRAAWFKRRFEEEAEQLKAYYERRRTQRGAGVKA